LCHVTPVVHGPPLPRGATERHCDNGRSRAKSGRADRAGARNNNTPAKGYGRGVVGK
jgi:hypothetical protein